MLVCSSFSAGQTQTQTPIYSQRGFLETQGTYYPQRAPNDSAHGVGEAFFRYEGFLTPNGPFQAAAAIDVQTDTHRQVQRHFSLSWQDRETQRPMSAVRRLSATYHKGPITFEAGKQ